MNELDKQELEAITTLYEQNKITEAKRRIDNLIGKYPQIPDVIVLRHLIYLKWEKWEATAAKVRADIAAKKEADRLAKSYQPSYLYMVLLILVICLIIWIIVQVF